MSKRSADGPDFWNDRRLIKLKGTGTSEKFKRPCTLIPRRSSQRSERISADWLITQQFIGGLRQFQSRDNPRRRIGEKSNAHEMTRFANDTAARRCRACWIRNQVNQLSFVQTDGFRGRFYARLFCASGVLFWIYPVGKNRGDLLEMGNNDGKCGLWLKYKLEEGNVPRVKTVVEC